MSRKYTPPITSNREDQRILGRHIY